jgi:hypothetical protein
MDLLDQRHLFIEHLVICLRREDSVTAVLRDGIRTKTTLY